jgi:hypothetical protein
LDCQSKPKRRGDRRLSFLADRSSSGLLAWLSGSALKVLVTLGLAATPPGSGSRPAEALFRDLVRAGTVSAGDRPDPVRRTGLRKNAVPRCTRDLAALGLMEKRSVCGALFILLNLGKRCYN